MPKPFHTHNRPAYRDDLAIQAVIDLFDDIDVAQFFIQDGEPATAKTIVDHAVYRFRSKVIDSTIKDLKVTFNSVGRLELFLDYADDLGVIRTTYTSRNPIND